MGHRRFAIAILALAGCTSANGTDAAVPLDGGDCLPGRNCLRPPDLLGTPTDGAAGDLALPVDACHKDTDCKGDRICVNGSCTDPPVADLAGADLSTPDLTVLDLVPPPDLWRCAVDGDCADPDFPRCDVARGRCVICLPANDNCPTNFYCGMDAPNGVPRMACVPGCKSDGDCGAGDGGILAACCGHVCVPTSADAKNCGGCWVTCGAQAAGCCGGACADLVNDTMNCGKCGHACVGMHVNYWQGAPCHSSNCNGAVCDKGWGNCDNDTNNGCETNTTTDPLNCGECGTVCPQGQHCVPSQGSGDGVCQ